MNAKEELLQNVSHALNSNLITRQELQNLIDPSPLSPQNLTDPSSPIGSEKPKSNLGAIDVLFHLAGIIFFAALMVAVFSSGSDSSVMRIILSLGVGLVFWATAYLLATQPSQTDVKEGLKSSLLLTGCLAVITGGFILTGEFTGELGISTAFSAAVTLAILGLLHIAFDRLLRDPILITFGVFLLVAAFPAAITGLLSDTDVPADVWGIVGITTGLLLGYGGRVASVSASNRQHFKEFFESVAAFVVLGSIYALGLSSNIAIFWELALPLTIYLAFFISIKRRSKRFLITGSLFLVIFLITVSFKYFSGLGAAFSLVLSALSILSTAFIASNINKKYIKPA